MSVEIIIRSGSMKYSSEFRRINEEWIISSFYLEKSDIQVLNDPQKYILDKGGNIFIALLNDEPIGTCALIVHDALTCELSRLVVDVNARNHGIGYKLGRSLIEKARERGFKRIILEGNTNMTASIALYRKLGFHEISYRANTVHTRCNIFMELEINPYSQLEYYI